MGKDDDEDEDWTEQLIWTLVKICYEYIKIYIFNFL